MKFCLVMARGTRRLVCITLLGFVDARRVQTNVAALGGQLAGHPTQTEMHSTAHNTTSSSAALHLTHHDPEASPSHSIREVSSKSSPLPFTEVATHQTTRADRMFNVMEHPIAAFQSIIDRATTTFTIMVTFLMLFTCICTTSCCVRTKAALPESPVRRRRGCCPTRKQFKFRDRLIFEWDQDETSVNVYISPPDDIKKQDIDVRLWPRHIIIRKKGLPPFIKDELYSAIDEQASSWNFSSKGELVVCLRKCETVEWPCVLLSHLRMGSSAKGYSRI